MSNVKHIVILVMHITLKYLQRKLIDQPEILAQTVTEKLEPMQFLNDTGRYLNCYV